MSNNHYIDGLTSTYTDFTANEELGLVQYQNVDLYKKDHINEILKLDYDFYVKDYGVHGANDFESLSFLEQDINIIVAGSKPNELPYANMIFSLSYYQDIQYIFSFSPDEERNDILEMMQDRSGNTYFAGYTPDPFVYSPTNTFEDILHITPKEGEGSEKKRFRNPFKRRGHHG